jgi:hypothetical protein
MWLSLVERFVRDEEVVGSNPVIPTIKRKDFQTLSFGNLFLFILILFLLLFPPEESVL